MAEKKSDKVKVYVVIGLAILAGVFAYFRFFHEKAPAATSTRATGIVPGSTADLQVPKIDFESLRKRASAKRDNTRDPMSGTRDILESHKNL